MSIFDEFIEDIMEVFMDGFLVFGDSFKGCLHNLDRIFSRCKETNLDLNSEKYHFMVREGIVLRHKILSDKFEVDKAKLVQSRSSLCQIPLKMSKASLVT